MNYSRYVPLAGLLGILLVFAVAFREPLATFDLADARLRLIVDLLVAGTVIAILRNQVGISTFGVFGPAIIAFIWIETGAVWGVVVFAFVFFVGIASRSLLSHYRLGTPHRVAILLVVTGVAMLTLLAVGTAARGVPTLGAAALFPVVLMTWYGDRFAGSVGEVGWQSPTKRLLWTLLVINVAYIVIQIDPLMSWVVATPESWVGLVAVNLVLGLTVDTRLRERFRFRALADKDGDFEGVLTMTERNRDYVNKYNDSRIMATLHKSAVKRLLHGLELPTPETYAVLESTGDLAELEAIADSRDEFVVKPEGGSGGEGILVVRGRTEDGDFETQRGAYDTDAVLDHARQIVEGAYAAEYEGSGVAVVESLVVADPFLKSRCGIGVPDVRVVLFKGIPVMSMTRLPTVESKGAANIHSGAVGVGLSIADGQSRRGYQQTQDRWLADHPDTGQPIDDFQLPDWEGVLTLAAKAAAATRLGYAGVDIVFDETDGPLLLEVNRRPGLGIQNANHAGLHKRLETVEDLPQYYEYVSATERVELARQLDRADWNPEVVDDA